MAAHEIIMRIPLDDGQRARRIDVLGGVRERLAWESGGFFIAAYALTPRESLRREPPRALRPNQPIVLRCFGATL